MTTTSLIMYMTLGEIAIVAIAIAIYIVIRARRLKQVTVIREKTVEKTPPPATAEPKLESHIQQLIRQTRKRLTDGHEEDTRVLEARIQFLEAEAALLTDDPLQDAYWTSVSQHLASLFPLDTDTQEPLAELDDIDAATGEDNEGAAGESSGSTETDTSREEISRLRSIIGRQHGAIDELKQSLLEQDISTTQAEELSKKLEHIEVAHAQLNMCIEVLEKENKRLNNLLSNDPPASGEAGDDLQETRQQLHRANERIGDLEQENSTQSQRIEALETEISSLQAQLHEREEQLRQAELISADLSRLDNDEPATDPETLRQQIETISELLMKKSEELQQLQAASADNAVPQEQAHSAATEAIPAAADTDTGIELFTTNDGDIDDEIPVLEDYAETPGAGDSMLGEAMATATPAVDILPHEHDDLLLDSAMDAENGDSSIDSAEPGGETELLDDGDMIPLNVADEAVELFDEHDIVVEDDYLDASIEDDINNFLNSHQVTGSTDGNDSADAVDDGPSNNTHEAAGNTVPPDIQTTG